MVKDHVGFARGGSSPPLGIILSSRVHTE
ncbi:uncharacterized protein METZ01_LOCUS75856 [marine metagenome]|uniref:Uncharacterized protein n=1 Tax=marine metagenome TaxID=408172 RepID=A0A381U435_9ZZZZ